MTATTPDLSTDVLDDLGQRAGRRRYLFWTLGLVAGLVVTVVLAVAMGAVQINPGTVLRIVSHHLFGIPDVATWPRSEDSIVWQVRLPRVLLGVAVGVAVGAALAVCGVALQAMVRNLLADPYLLGVTSGASTGAAAAILFGFGAALGENALSGSAFIGALAASVAVFVVARTGGRVTSLRLLISGVAVAALVGAIFLVWADVSARVLLQPRELPIGIITAIVGAPFLVLLVRRFHATTE